MFAVEIRDGERTRRTQGLKEFEADVLVGTERAVKVLGWVENGVLNLQAYDDSIGEYIWDEPYQVETEAST